MLFLCKRLLKSKTKRINNSYPKAKQNELLHKNIIRDTSFCDEFFKQFCQGFNSRHIFYYKSFWYLILIYQLAKFHKLLSTCYENHEPCSMNVKKTNLNTCRNVVLVMSQANEFISNLSNMSKISYLWARRYCSLHDHTNSVNLKDVITWTHVWSIFLFSLTPIKNSA
jgi:hypothetical protein